MRFSRLDGCTTIMVFGWAGGISSEVAFPDGVHMYSDRQRTMLDYDQLAEVKSKRKLTHV